MNLTRLALVGAAIVALTSPVLAQSGKADRMSGARAGKMTTAPVAMPRRAPVQSWSGTDWDARYGYDRASSPFGHGGY